MAEAIKFTEPLDSKNYPSVRFWTRELWTAHLNQEKAISNPSEPSKRGSTLAAQGVNVATRYIETEEGEPVNGFQSTTMRQKAYQLFVDFAGQGLAPTTWGQAGSRVEDAFNDEMCRHFSEFWLCANGWKAHFLATQIYPTWYTGYKKKSAAQVKVEVISDADNTSIASNSSSIQPKCARKESVHSTSSKKSKNAHRKSKEMVASPLAAQISQS